MYDMSVFRDSLKPYPVNTATAVYRIRRHRFCVCCNKICSIFTPKYLKRQNSLFILENLFFKVTGLVHLAIDYLDLGVSETRYHN